MEETTAQSPSTSLAPAAGEKSAAVTQSPPPQSAQSNPAQKKSGSKMMWIVILSILFVGFLMAAAWYFQNQLQKTAMENKPGSAASSASTTPKELIIGTDPTLPPMEFLQNGNFVGYDIDLENLLAKQMGVKVVFKNVVFDNIFNALQQNQIDLIISAVTITPERQQKYDFSEEYLNAGQVIITQKTNTSNQIAS